MDTWNGAARRMKKVYMGPLHCSSIAKYSKSQNPCLLETALKQLKVAIEDSAQALFSKEQGIPQNLYQKKKTIEIKHTRWFSMPQRINRASLYLS